MRIGILFSSKLTLGHRWNFAVESIAGEDGVYPDLAQPREKLDSIVQAKAISDCAKKKGRAKVPLQSAVGAECHLARCRATYFHSSVPIARVFSIS
jgi:hypothetical protein